MQRAYTNWKIRRTLMFVVTVFCMAVVWRGMQMDTDTAMTSVRLAFYTIIGVMLIYVFAVVTDDHIQTFIKAKYGIRDDDTDK